MLRRSPLRRSAMKPSRPSDPIPASVRAEVKALDGGCVFARLGIAHDCFGAVQLDHIRASGGLGLKSPSTVDNLCSLCPSAHALKTRDGRVYRPILLAYVVSRTRQANNARLDGVRAHLERLR